MTGDETQTFGNRFLPLLQLGLADDNQYYGYLRTAMLDFFAAMPRDATGAAVYANFIRMALSGAQLDFALSDDDFTSMLLGGVTKRWTAFADITREANYFGSMIFVSSVKNGTFTDTSANENIVWSGGNLTITETGGYDHLILPGVVLACISWRVVGTNVTLILAPSAAGQADGGTISFPPGCLNAIVLADGNAVLSEDIKTAALCPTGTAASEKIVGSSINQFWNDTITGGGGNDTLEGGDGDDTFVWNFGDGQDVLDGGRLTNDTIRFGVGITKAHLSFKLVGSDVLLTIAPSAVGGTNGGSILLKNQTDTGWAIETLAFADGTTLTTEDIKTTVLTNKVTATGEKITGSSVWGYWNDTIIGGGGNDTLEGGDGDDIYIWNRGDGNDEISDTYGTDTIRFGVAITKAQIGAKLESEDIRLTIAPSVAGKTDGGSILIKKQTYGNNAIEAIAFSDGATLTADDIKTMVLTIVGTAAAKKIVRPYVYDFANDTIIGGGGNDTLEGGDGNDTYIWNRGDGNDEISDSYGTDTICFGAGITKVQFGAKLVGEDVRLMIAPSTAGGTNGGSVLIKKQTYGSNAIEAIAFADGTTLTADDIKTMALTITGTAASEKIVGSSEYQFWNDTISGGGGNDTLEGGGGDDVFTFSIGHGHDLVNDFDQWGDDVLSFSKNMFSSWNAVAAATKQVGADVVIATSATSSVRLLNTSLSSFNADDVRLAA